MIDKRPKQLVNKVKATVEENDSVISDALDELQKDVLAEKKRPTMKNLRKKCGLSEGAIRSRVWAVERLKTMKATLKPERKTQPTEAKPQSETQLLKGRIKDLLVENAILFDEITSLNELVDRMDRENKALSNRLKLKISNTENY